MPLTKHEELRVLLVEDSPDLLVLYAEGLKRYGFHVSAASSGAEGLMKYRDTAPDVVLCDLSMPNGTGFELVEEMRRDGRHVPAAAVTAFNDAATYRQAMEAGFDECVFKPVMPGELAWLVKMLATRADRLDDGEPLNSSDA